MVAVKTSILIGVASVAMLAAVGQDQSEADAVRRANMAASAATAYPVTAQPVLPPADTTGLAPAIATWRAIQQTDALPFDSYASFLLQHPGWPAEAGRRRAAEAKANTASPASVVAFFRRYPPLTADGGAAYAQALSATGQGGADAARTAWRRGSMSAGAEAVLTQQFASAFTPADHDARMDMLLWQGATGAAQRQLYLVSPARRALFEARLAFRTNATDAAALAAATDAAGATDAGYVADKATWWRGAMASNSARDWLARTRSPGMTRPGDVETFYEVLLTNARGAAADGQAQTAYDIARQIDDAYPAGTDVSTRPYGERDDYTSLAWLAGQTAMTRLGRPADAMAMFDRYGRASQSPQTRAKGFYWAGRAAAAAGRTAEADAFFQRAAGYRDQFYGQLANERLGRALAAPPALVPRPVDPAYARAFYARETVRAAQLLGAIGDWQTQTAFVRQIATDARSDADHVLANDLARTIGRPDLGVMVGRSALQNGYGDYSAAGFPTVAVPAGYEDMWTMVHAIGRQESQFDRMAMSRVGARGLLQLMPGTARDTARKLGVEYDAGRLLTDTGYNAQLGAAYFQQIYARLGSYPLAVAAYNAGPGNVNKWLSANGDPRSGGIDMVDWIEAIPYQETRNYVQRVLENAVVYDLMNPARARSRGPANLSWYLARSGGRVG